MLQRSGRAIDFVEPCLLSPAETPSSGPEWIHEIRHDGFPHSGARRHLGVRLYTRNGQRFPRSFPLVVAAVAALPVRSCLIDGEAIVNDAGLAVFELIRSWRHDDDVLYTFDLLEFDGEDLRRPQSRARLAAVSPASGHRPQQHYVGHGEIVYQQACKLGYEGIVSKRSARSIASAARA